MEIIYSMVYIESGNWGEYKNCDSTSSNKEESKDENSDAGSEPKPCFHSAVMARLRIGTPSISCICCIS